MPQQLQHSGNGSIKTYARTIIKELSRSHYLAECVGKIANEPNSQRAKEPKSQRAKELKSKKLKVTNQVHKNNWRTPEFNRIKQKREAATQRQAK